MSLNYIFNNYLIEPSFIMRHNSKNRNYSIENILIELIDIVPMWKTLAISLLVLPLRFVNGQNRSFYIQNKTQ